MQALEEILITHRINFWAGLTYIHRTTFKQNFYLQPVLYLYRCRVFSLFHCHLLALHQQLLRSSVPLVGYFDRVPNENHILGSIWISVVSLCFHSLGTSLLKFSAVSFCLNATHVAEISSLCKDKVESCALANKWSLEITDSFLRNQAEVACHYAGRARRHLIGFLGYL